MCCISLDRAHLRATGLRPGAGAQPALGGVCALILKPSRIAPTKRAIRQNHHFIRHWHAFRSMSSPTRVCKRMPVCGTPPPQGGSTRLWSITPMHVVPEKFIEGGVVAHLSKMACSRATRSWGQHWSPVRSRATSQLRSCTAEKSCRWRVASNLTAQGEEP